MSPSPRIAWSAWSRISPWLPTSDLRARLRASNDHGVTTNGHSASTPLDSARSERYLAVNCSSSFVVLLMSFWLVDKNNRQEGYFNFLQLRELREQVS